MEKRDKEIINELIKMEPRKFYSFINWAFDQYASSHKQHTDWKDVIAYKIRKYRAENGMSCESLARRLGVTRMQVFRWEKGRCKPGNLAMEKMRSVGIL